MPKAAEKRGSTAAKRGPAQTPSPQQQKDSPPQRTPRGPPANGHYRMKKVPLASLTGPTGGSSKSPRLPPPAAGLRRSTTPRDGAPARRQPTLTAVTAATAVACATAQERQQKEEKGQQAAGPKPGNKLSLLTATTAFAACALAAAWYFTYGPGVPAPPKPESWWSQ